VLHARIVGFSDRVFALPILFLLMSSSHSDWFGIFPIDLTMLSLLASCLLFLLRLLPCSVCDLAAQYFGAHMLIS
jgi:hypothetical protein